jgi:hypothetical protein
MYNASYDYRSIAPWSIILEDKVRYPNWAIEPNNSISAKDGTQNKRIAIVRIVGVTVYIA